MARIDYGSVEISLEDSPEDIRVSNKFPVTSHECLSDSTQEFVIEYFVDKRTVVRKVNRRGVRCTEYLTKWENYPSNENTCIKSING